MQESPSIRLIGLFQGVRLTPTQRRIAQCLVEHAGTAAYLSSGELAELAQVSQPSVTRFAMAVGYDGYPALRRAMRELVTNGPAETADDARRNELQRAVAAEIDNLRHLGELLADPRPITEAGKVLTASRPLPVVGLRSAAHAAGYFGYFAAKIHPDVRVLDSGGSLLADRLDQARAAGATAMLAFVLPRYPREALDALAEARRQGLKTVVITDSAVSPVAEHADLTLPAAVGSQLVFDLHTAPMVLAMVLLQAMCDAAPGDTAERLERFEQSAARRQIFT